MDWFKFTRQYGKQQRTRAEQRMKRRNRQADARLRRDCERRGYHSFIRFAGSNVRACSWCGAEEKKS